MIKLFSLKQQKKEEESAGGTKGTSKKASAAQLRIQKGGGETGERSGGEEELWGAGKGPRMAPVWPQYGLCTGPSMAYVLVPVWPMSWSQYGLCTGPSMAPV